MILPNR